MGNLKAPPRKTIVQCVLAAWNQVSKESVIKAFRCCALSLPNDGSKDDEIHCFKENQSYSAGRNLLKSQLAILTKDNPNPFVYQPDKEDIALAAPLFLLVDQDEEEDADIDIDV